MNPWDEDPEAMPWDSDPEPPKQSFGRRLVNAAGGMLNDLSAGFQGVNPVSLAKKQGQAVGVLKDGYVDVDGTREPLEKYPADRYVSRFEPENGQTYLYPRTPDLEESRAASAGRLLGYGMPDIPAPRQAAPAAQDARSVGVVPSFAMGGRGRSVIAAAGEQFAPTAGVFRQDAARVTDELGKAAGNLADKAGPGSTPAQAGEALKSGADTFLSNVNKRESALYEAVDKAIPPDTKILAPATSGFLRAEIEKLAGVPEIAASLGNNRLAGWLKDLEGGNLTWVAARNLRTQIGEAIGSITGPTADMAQGRLKQIYGRLSEDLGAAAAKSGPEASRAWNRATTYTRVSQERIESALVKVTGAKSPEAAYDAVMGMTAEGGSRANVSALSKVFQSIPKDARATVAGTIIRRMGRATAGAQDAAGEAFSPETFLTNWNKMSPAARDIVGRNGFDPGVGQELSKLARTIERAKEAGKARNKSNTGSVLTTFGLGAAFSIAPWATVALGVASHLSARALTSREFLSAVNTYAATGRAGPLLRIARGESPLAIEAATILRLQSAETSRPLALPAPE